MILYASGIASSFLSRDSCRKHSDILNEQWFENVVRKEEVVHLRPDQLVNDFKRHPVPKGDLVGRYRLLNYAFPLRLLIPLEWADNAWSYSVAEITPWPFIVRVDYGRFGMFSYGGCGSAGTRVYATFFRKAVPLGEWPVVMW
jgi:hypothetical protein